jgi:hypothetical protein
MKKLLLSTIFSFIIMLIAAVAFSIRQDEKDYSLCLKKVNKKFGAETKICPTSNKPYKVWFVNSCNDTLAVKLAVQESSKRWRTFTRLRMMPGDTISGFACTGQGKYLYYAKHYADQSVELPSDEEIDSSNPN